MNLPRIQPRPEDLALACCAALMALGVVLGLVARRIDRGLSLPAGAR